MLQMYVIVRLDCSLISQYPVGTVLYYETSMVEKNSVHCCVCYCDGCIYMIVPGISLAFDIYCVYIDLKTNKMLRKRVC